MIIIDERETNPPHYNYRSYHAKKNKESIFTKKENETNDDENFGDEDKQTTECLNPINSPYMENQSSLRTTNLYSSYIAGSIGSELARILDPIPEDHSSIIDIMIFDSDIAAYTHEITQHPIQFSIKDSKNLNQTDSPIIISKPKTNYLSIEEEYEAIDENTHILFHIEISQEKTDPHSLKSNDDYIQISIYATFFNINETEPVAEYFMKRICETEKDKKPNNENNYQLLNQPIPLKNKLPAKKQKLLETLSLYTNHRYNLKHVISLIHNSISQHARTYTIHGLTPCTLSQSSIAKAIMPTKYKTNITSTTTKNEPKIIQDTNKVQKIFKRLHTRTSKLEEINISETLLEYNRQSKNPVDQEILAQWLDDYKNETIPVITEIINEGKFDINDTQFSHRTNSTYIDINKNITTAVSNIVELISNHSTIYPIHTFNLKTNTKYLEQKLLPILANDTSINAQLIKAIKETEKTSYKCKNEINIPHNSLRLIKCLKEQQTLYMERNQLSEDLNRLIRAKARTKEEQLSDREKHNVKETEKQLIPKAIGVARFISLMALLKTKSISLAYVIDYLENNENPNETNPLFSKFEPHRICSIDQVKNLEDTFLKPYIEMMESQSVTVEYKLDYGISHMDPDEFISNDPDQGPKTQNERNNKWPRETKRLTPTKSRMNSI